MRTLSKYLFLSFFGAVALTSCNRQVAYFQPSAREHYTSVQPKAVTPATEAVATPVETTAPVETNVSSAEVAPVTTPTEQIAQAKQAVSQVEAYVRNDSKLASNKKLAKRMAKLNEMLAVTSNKAAVSTNATSAKKMTLMERMMLKKMDKKIKNHVAPDKTKAMDRNVRLGLIIGLIGLILWLLGGGSVLAVIGIVMFVVGLVLLLLGLLNA